MHLYVGLRWKALLVLSAAAFLVSSCGAHSKNAPDSEVSSTSTTAKKKGQTVVVNRLRNNSLDFSAYTLETFDINGDGQSDVLRYTQNGIARVVRYDLDFDGRIDMTAYYDAAGVLQEQDFYLDTDDVVDVVRLYQGGKLHKKKVSIDFNGNYPVLKYYDANGNLQRVERDSDGDGHMDIWDYYHEGSLVRVANDSDGDGTPDHMDEIQ